MSPLNPQQLAATTLPVAGGVGDAAVLIPIVRRRSSPATLLLIRRAAWLRRHAGEVAFPGGRREKEDADLCSTALRESEEEVGLSRQAVQPIGRLPEMNTRFDTRVAAYIGLVDEPSSWRPDRHEVESVFEVPIDFFCAANLEADEYVLDGKVRRIPRFSWEDYNIWGFTAMLIVVFCRRCLDRSLDVEGLPAAQVRRDFIKAALVKRELGKRQP